MPQILGKALTFIILSKQEDSRCHYGLIEPAYIFFHSFPLMPLFIQGTHLF